MRPLEMSMVVSQPGMMGQVAGSEARVEGVEERLRPKIRREKEILCFLKEKEICSFCKQEMGLLVGWQATQLSQLSSKDCKLTHL